MMANTQQTDKQEQEFYFVFTAFLDHNHYEGFSDFFRTEHPEDFDRSYKQFLLDYSPIIIH